MIVIGTLEQTPEERLDTDDLEVLPAHFASPRRPRYAISFQTKILHLNGGYRSEHRMAIAHIARFRIGKKGGTIFGLQVHQPVWARHIEWPQEQCFEDAEYDDVGGDAERQDKDRSEGKAGRTAHVA